MQEARQAVEWEQVLKRPALWRLVTYILSPWIAAGRILSTGCGCYLRCSSWDGRVGTVPGAGIILGPAPVGVLVAVPVVRGAVTGVRVTVTGVRVPRAGRSSSDSLL